MHIYFDIGNANIKVHFVNAKLNNYIAYDSGNLFTVDSFWNQLPDIIKQAQVVKVMICSVVPKLTPIIVGVAKKYFCVTPLIIGFPLKTGIQIQVDDPKIVGTDLVCLGSFAKANGDNVIVVNMGTATTLTHVKKSIFKGVIIMAGLQLQIDALVAKAAKIGDLDIAFSRERIGKNSEQAISLGIINAHIYAIASLIANIDPQAKIILSGGHAKHIAPFVDYEYVKEATIEGMKIIEHLNEK